MCCMSKCFRRHLELVAKFQSGNQTLLTHWFKLNSTETVKMPWPLKSCQIILFHFWMPWPLNCFNYLQFFISPKVIGPLWCSPFHYSAPDQQRPHKLLHRRIQQRSTAVLSSMVSLPSRSDRLWSPRKRGTVRSMWLSGCGTSLFSTRFPGAHVGDEWWVTLFMCAHEREREGKKKGSAVSESREESLDLPLIRG